MVLGIGYWAGFMKQNKHLVKAKKAVKFDIKGQIGALTKTLS